MARILFIGADAGGNLPPAIAIARELAARGHDVEVAGIRPRDPGTLPWTAVPFPAMDSFELTSAAGRVRLGAKLLRFTLSRAAARDTAAVIAERRPDLVVVDCMMFPSIDAATASGVPTAALFHTFGQYWLDAFVHGPNAAILRLRGVPAVRVWSRARLRLVASDRALDPLGASPVDFEWTGSTEVGAPPARDAEPLVLASLSSLWAPGEAALYRRIAEALGDLAVRAILTTGGVELEGRIDTPPNVELRGRVPHSELLPRASLLIGHGGHSTTLKALAHGVPALVLPVNALADQALIGRIVTQNGLGSTLPMSASADRIRDAAAAILADAAIRDTALRTGERLRAVDGAARAADRLEAVLG